MAMAAGHVDMDDSDRPKKRLILNAFVEMCMPLQN